MEQGFDVFEGLNPCRSVPAHGITKRGHARREGDLSRQGGSAQGVGDASARPEYLEAARYYLAHIAYDEGRLTTALAAFEELLAVEARNAVPVYIAQIPHQLQRYEDLVERAPTWLDDAADLRPSDCQEPADWGIAHFHLEIVNLTPFSKRHGNHGQPTTHRVQLSANVAWPQASVADAIRA